MRRLIRSVVERLCVGFMAPLALALKEQVGAKMHSYLNERHQVKYPELCDNCDAWGRMLFSSCKCGGVHTWCSKCWGHQ